MWLSKLLSGRKISLALLSFFAVLCIAVGMIIFLPHLVLHSKMQSAKENGVEVTAYDVEMTGDTVSYKGVKYYSLSFTFHSPDGKFKDGVTSCAYTELAAMNAVMDGHITVLATNDAVCEKGFVLKTANRPYINVLLLFCGVGVAVPIIGVAGMLFARKGGVSAHTHGVVTRGKILGRTADEVVENTRFCGIKVAFENQRGEKVVGVTEKTYTPVQADVFKKGMSVEIKYYGTQVDILNVDVQADGDLSE